MAKFEAGKPRHPKAGRRKGTPNKATASVKEALMAAFDKMGGVPALVAWGKENPGAFYPIWVRIAPQQHDITSAGQPLEALIASSRKPVGD